MPSPRRALETALLAKIAAALPDGVGVRLRVEGTDMHCHRCGEPVSLFSAEVGAWPALDWGRWWYCPRHGALVSTRSGRMPTAAEAKIDQVQAALAAAAEA